MKGKIILSSIFTIVILVVFLFFVTKPATTIVDGQWSLIAIDCETFEPVEGFKGLAETEICINVTNLKTDEPQRDMELGIRFFTDESKAGVIVEKFGLWKETTFNENVLMKTCNPFNTTTPANLSNGTLESIHTHTI